MVHPFDSHDFHDFSEQRAITTRHFYPYHPQGNAAECFMKPLGKAIKVALDTKIPIKQAIDDLLVDYRSTPYVVTGIASGDMLLRGGSNLPSTAKPITDSILENARQQDKQDKERKQKVNGTINSSRWRKYPTIIQCNEVLVLRSSGKTKFQSKYEQMPYTVVDIKGKRYTLLASDPKYHKQPIYRHASQIRLHQEPVPSMPMQPRRPRRANPMPFRDTDLPSRQRRLIDGK